MSRIIITLKQIVKNGSNLKKKFDDEDFLNFYKIDQCSILYFYQIFLLGNWQQIQTQNIQNKIRKRNKRNSIDNFQKLQKIKSNIQEQIQIPMNNKMTDILNVLHSIGYNIKNDKTLKEPQKNPEVIWQILALLCRWCNGIDQQNNLDECNPAFIYLIDLENHNKVIKWNNECNMIKQTLTKLNVPFLLRGIFRGDKQYILDTMSNLIKYGKQRQEFYKKFNQKLFDIKHLEEQVQKNKASVKSNEILIAQLKQKKQKQLPEYTQIIQRVTDIQKQINYKKNQKSEVLAQKKKAAEKKQECNRKILQQKNESQSNKLKIIQLKKEIANNIPQIKHERIKIQQQFIQLEHDKEEIEKIRKKKIVNLQKYTQQYHLAIQQFIQKINICINHINKYLQYSNDSNNLKNQIQLRIDFMKDLKKEFQANNTSIFQLDNTKLKIENILKQFESRIKHIGFQIKSRYQEKITKQNDQNQLMVVQRNISQHIEITNNKIETIRKNNVNKINSLKTAFANFSMAYSSKLNQLYSFQQK